MGLVTIRIAAMVLLVCSLSIRTATSREIPSILRFQCRLFSAGPSKYKALTYAVRHELTVKRSKFVAQIVPASSLSEGLQLVKELSDARASHNCWAVLCADEKGEPRWRCSDDGEPAGTAGRPILSALEALQLVNAVAVVSRHFGGVKLGAGGLARAYGGAVRDALALPAAQAALAPFVPRRGLLVSIPVSMSSSLLRVASSLSAQCEFSSETESPENDNDEHEPFVSIRCLVPTENIVNFESAVRETFSGRALIRVLNDNKEDS